MFYSILFLCIQIFTWTGTECVHLPTLPETFEIRYNIIWFIVEPLNNGTVNTDITSRELAFCRVVKPCSDRSNSPEGAPEEEIVTPEEELLEKSVKQKKQNACDCPEIFNDSVESLLEWAKNRLRMSTTSIMITPSTKVERYKKSTENFSGFPGHFDTMIETVDRYKKRSANISDLSRHLDKRFARKHYEKLVRFPVTDNYQKALQHNARNPHKRKKHKSQGIQYVEKTPLEVFSHPTGKDKHNFRSTENDLSSDYNENRNNDDYLEKSSDDVPQVWNIFSIMANIHRFMDQNAKSGNDNIDITSLNLYDMVRNTIDQMEDLKNPNGYLAVIRGGKLEELDEAESDITKSVYYARQKTSDNETLLVLSVSCPEDLYNEKSYHEATLPIFCTGPHCKELEEAEELSDIAKILKKTLYSSSFCRKQRFTSTEKRLARMLVETYFDINEMERDEHRNGKVIRKRNAKEDLLSDYYEDNNAATYKPGLILLLVDLFVIYWIH